MATQPDAELVYLPAIVRAATVYISNSKMDIDGIQNVTMFTKLSPGTDRPDFKDSLKFPGTVDRLNPDPAAGGNFGELPAIAMESKSYTAWGKDFVDEIYRTGGLTVLHSPKLRAYSRPGEDETDFRIRLQDAAREKRDEAVEKLRVSYGKKVDRLEGQIERAMEHLAEQKSQASSAKLNTAVSLVRQSSARSSAARASAGPV